MKMIETSAIKISTNCYYSVHFYNFILSYFFYFDYRFVKCLEYIQGINLCHKATNLCSIFCICHIDHYLDNHVVLLFISLFYFYVYELPGAFWEGLKIL